METRFCREMPNEPQLYQMPSSIRNMVNAAAIHPMNTYNVHDLANYTDESEEHAINLDRAVELLDDSTNLQPEIEAFLPQTNMISYGTIISDLNAEAKLFIPPYDRYRKYRSLAQMEEIKEFKEKEAKITAISKGNELIKAEVLAKLQQAKAQIENEEQNSQTKEMGEVGDIDDAQKKTQQRKRKISTVKVENKESAVTVTENKKKELPNTNTQHNLKTFAYKNVDYKKFYKNTNKEHNQKQHKMKFKKYKK